jgi:peptidyl-prolyl cis-trans isomerase SurA
MIRARAMFRRRGRLVAVALLLLSVGAAHADVKNRIIATVDGEPITALELRRYIKDRNAESVPEHDSLQALITDKLLEHEIKALGIAAHDDEIDRYVQEIQTRNGMDEEHFKQALAAQGLTMEIYRARVKAEIEKAQLVNREIRSRVNISPEELKRYYDAHLTDYETDERVRVREILFTVDAGADEGAVERARAKAEEVRKMARDGADFTNLMKQFSDAPGADKGGDLGTFARGQMERALEEAAFGRKKGEISEPVRTGTGFHLLRVEERISSGHKPFDEVKDDIRERLYNDALEERFQNWISHDLRERHRIEVLD